MILYRLGGTTDARIVCGSAASAGSLTTLGGLVGATYAAVAVPLTRPSR